MSETETPTPAPPPAVARHSYSPSAVPDCGLHTFTTANDDEAIAMSQAAAAVAILKRISAYETIVTHALGQTYGEGSQMAKGGAAVFAEAKALIERNQKLTESTRTMILSFHAARTKAEAGA